MRPTRTALLGALVLGAATSTLHSQPAEPAPKSLLLWKATSGKNTAYLFGSIHIGSKWFYPLPQPIEDAFAASNVLVVEVDVRKLDLLSSAAIVMSQGMYTGDDQLWNHISPANRKAVEAACEKNSLPVFLAARMKPWMLAMTLAVIPYQKLGMDPKLGLDVHFLDTAAARRVDQLESAEWQVQLFSSLPDDQQEALLAAALEETADSAQSAEDLVAAWRSGDAARVAALMAKSEAGSPELSHKLREERNPRMAAAVEQCLKKAERCFVVVGAAHLVGAQSVVELLGERGIQVEQMHAAVVSPSSRPAPAR